MKCDTLQDAMMVFGDILQHQFTNLDQISKLQVFNSLLSWLCAQPMLQRMNILYLELKTPQHPVEYVDNIGTVILSTACIQFPGNSRTCRLKTPSEYKSL